MGLFYAYLKHSERDDVDRYIIVFASRETADEWWRAISTPPSPYMGYVQRFVPQFYTHDPGTIHVVWKFFEWQGSKSFLNKMFFLLLNDNNERNLSIAPPADITDHISGGWYFIRSKAGPPKYWYFNSGNICQVCGEASCNTVHASTVFRTKFRIQVRNLIVPHPNELVMIGADIISVSAFDDYNLHITKAGELRATKGYDSQTSDILFRDLKNRFVARGTKEIHEDVASVERGAGEAWELAD